MRTNKDSDAERMVTQPVFYIWRFMLIESRGEMAPAERKNYTDAVLCLTRKPPRLSTAEYAGVRSRFDDFVACVLEANEVYKYMH